MECGDDAVVHVLGGFHAGVERASIWTAFTILIIKYWPFYEPG